LINKKSGYPFPLKGTDNRLLIKIYDFNYSG